MAFEFNDETKRKIFQRQSGLCAHCGNRGIANYHHVVPRQSGDPNNMLHGWLSTETNGVGLCAFDHQAVHIGDDAQFKVRYATGAVPPATFFEFAHGKGDKADPAKQTEWESRHARLAEPIWKDLERRYGSSQTANLSPSNMSPSGGAGEKPSVDLAKGRARLRQKSGGFVDLGLRSGKGLNKQQAAAGALLAGMTIGAALKYALECRNESGQQKDIAEWERWIRQQQSHAPSAGYLLAVQYSIYTMGPADPVVTYVLTAGYPANTVEKAAELMRKDPPHNLLVRSGEYDPGQYTYPDPMLHWYPPLAPFAADVPNQKLRAILAAMEPPSDDREAFGILDGSSMSELLEIYPVLFKNMGYSCLWRSIDHAKISNRNRLHVAAKAVRARQDGLSFGNFYATAAILLPEKGAADYQVLANYFGASNGSKLVPAWLQGWWAVYDGNYYYYYFLESPTVVYTKTKPANGSAPAPQNPANRGTVALTENGCKITWNRINAGNHTIETFWQLHAKANEMNGESNKYGQLFARKM